MDIINDLLSSIGGIAGFCALAGIVLKLWPGAVRRLGTMLYGNVDPDLLPAGSAMSAHWARTAELAEGQRRLEDNQREVRKDVIKNTLISLMADRDADHSEAIRYELAKLAELDADCWVIDAARQYLIDHQTKAKTIKEEPWQTTKQPLTDSTRH